MPGIRFVRRLGENGVPKRLSKTLGKSVTLFDGDLVCLTTSGTYAVTASTPVLRKLATADRTALYETAANDPVGLLGLICDALVTDTSAAITSAPSAVTLAGGVQPRYMMPAYGSTLKAAADGSSRASIIIADAQTDFGGFLLETTTITDALVDTMVGLDMTVTSGVTAFKWSTAAATKIGRIVDVNRSHPKYNVSGGGGEVFVRILSQFCQDSNNFNYAT